MVVGDSGCGETIRRIGGGRVLPTPEPPLLADALAEVLADPDAWRAEAARAGAVVRADFSGGVVAERLDVIYAAVRDHASSPKRPAR